MEIDYNKIQKMIDAAFKKGADDIAAKVAEKLQSGGIPLRLESKSTGKQEAETIPPKRPLHNLING